MTNTMNKKEKSVTQKAHEEALKKAKQSLPKMDAVKVLKIALEYIRADSDDRKQQLKDLAAVYGKAGFLYVRSFGQTAFNQYLENTDNEYLKKLGKNNIGKELVVIAEQVGDAVFEYMKKEHDAEKLKERLVSIKYNNALNKVIKAAGFDPKEIKDLNLNSLELTHAAIAYSAFTKAYKIYQKALEDRALAIEYRLIIEEECNESIHLIVSYREEMNQRVSEYLIKHIETFQEGFALMDQAILADDPDGYIAGNVEIQKILGYDIQFTNQEEFEDLMLSDDAFKF